MDQDLTNMGYWLYYKKEYFSWDQKLRFVYWILLFFLVQICQFVFMILLILERMENEGELNEAMDLLNQNKTELFNELPYSN